MSALFLCSQDTAALLLSLCLHLCKLHSHTQSPCVSLTCHNSERLDVPHRFGALWLSAWREYKYMAQEVNHVSPARSLTAGEFACVGGTNSKAILCTSDGTVLSTLASCSSWVWCVRAHPKKNCIAVGSQDGSIAIYQLIFSTVHGLYHDRYAFRYT